MREACGSNDHPDSSLFIQMFRLILTYFLVKPPRGCNITSGEVMNALVTLKDIKDCDTRKEKWNNLVQKIIKKGQSCNGVADATKYLEDHDQYKFTSSDYVIAYIAGFIARKAFNFSKCIVNKKYTNCDDCKNSLILDSKETVPENCKLIDLKSKGFFDLSL